MGDITSLSSWLTPKTNVRMIELAFYIDKKGKRVRKEWSISWEGSPSAFAFRFPYVVAFNTNFIEVRHMDTVSTRADSHWAIY